VFGSKSLAALSFDITYIDDANGTFATRGWLDPDSLFQQNIRAAANLWGAQFDSNETIVMNIDPVSFAARAGGTNTLGRFLYENSAGKDVWEFGPLTRILTGDNPGEDFYGYDILLGFDAEFVQANYWFDPQPELRSASVPSNKGDFVSVVLHEMGHGFGMTGYRDYDTSEITGDTATQFDDLSYYGGDGNPFDPDGAPNPLFFGGNFAASLYGSDLPLTHKPADDFRFSQNFYHLSACDAGSADGLEGTLMNGCVLPNGERLYITQFDLATYADMGYPLAQLPGDYNDNGTVDAADYAVWRKGVAVAPTQANYNLWRANFDMSSPGGGSVIDVNAPVPEPATLAMLILAAAGVSTRRRRST
jgi:hypothetical protein